MCEWKGSFVNKKELFRISGIIINLQQCLCHLSHIFDGTVPEPAEICQGRFYLWKDYSVEKLLFPRRYHHFQFLFFRKMALLNRVGAEHPTDKPQHIFTASFLFPYSLAFYIPFSLNYTKCLGDEIPQQPQSWL